MATAMDDFIGCALEPTYGTAVTVTRFYPWMPGGTNGNWEPQVRTGQGVLGGAGRTMVRASRAFLASGRGVVKVKAELETRAGGVLFTSAFGVAVAPTAITGGSVQIFHTQVPNLVLPSLTWQLRKILNDGSARVETFRGCTATKVKIQQPVNAIPTIEAEYDALAFTTATAAAVPSYSATSNLYDAMHGSVGYAGTLTVPTGSTIASGLTADTKWRSWELELSQEADIDGWVLTAGNRSQPKVGMATGKLTGEIEWNDNVIPDAYNAGTQAAWMSQWQHPTETVGAVPALMQIVLPRIMWTKVPTDVSPGEAARTLSVEADVQSNGTDRDVYCVYRTQDTAA